MKIIYEHTLAGLRLPNRWDKVLRKNGWGLCSTLPERIWSDEFDDFVPTTEPFGYVKEFEDRMVSYEGFLAHALRLGPIGRAIWQVERLLNIDVLETDHDGANVHFFMTLEQPPRVLSGWECMEHLYGIGGSPRQLVERLSGRKDSVILAAQAAARWHAGQKRKYTGVPYIVHPGRVAARISRHPRATVEMICAAWLHDVLEDCALPAYQVGCLFPDCEMSLRIVRLVEELTNPSKKFPKLSRAARKAMDRKHLKSVSKEARLIKLADRADNVNDLEGAAGDFSKKYYEESVLLLKELAGTDEELENELGDALQSLSGKLCLP